MTDDCNKNDSETDYGYDLTAEDEDELNQLVDASSKAATAGLETTAHKRAEIPDEDPSASTDYLGNDSLDSIDYEALATAERFAHSAQANIRYPSLSRPLSQIKEGMSWLPPDLTSTEGTADRSPLDRFRKFPRKPLTVSDLISGSWCELQFWYTLTRLPGGRKTRTREMRAGSKVHRKFEDEVHESVRVEVLRREDNFALRLWNIVQGLRTLRETGLTRELEVWGMVDGNVVNGVIDGLSYENPNMELEEDLSRPASQEGMDKQTVLTDFYPPEKKNDDAEEEKKNDDAEDEKNDDAEEEDEDNKIYLVDIKTRGSTASVSKGQLRQAQYQLLLYHRFLSDMAAGKLDFSAVLQRYAMDADRPFSDTFLAQISQVHQEIFYDAPSTTTELESAQTEPLNGTPAEDNKVGGDTVRYRTLRQLVPLVEEEMRATFPRQEASVGPILRVQYVHREDRRELETHDFPASKDALDEYLKAYMAWWRGEREARGVDLEEAYKCGSCEFGDSCAWREKMGGEVVQKAWTKVYAARKAAAQP